MPPQAGIAQQAGRVYRIGFLGVASAAASVTLRRMEAFRTGMRALGYVEGGNVIIDFRWAEGDADGLGDSTSITGPRAYPARPHS